MTINYIAFTSTGYPKSINTFTITKNSWHVYLLCDTDLEGYCYFYNDVKQIKNVEDKKKVQNALLQLGQRCESGNPLKEFYDEKKCHEAFTFSLFKHSDNTQDVWRIRQGDVRIYFIYLPPEKRIILLGVSVKRKDNISEKEKNHLTSLAIKALEDDLASFNNRVRKL